MKKAYLVLENGSVFEGQAVGAEGYALGEMVFTTGVVGYIETLTDPGYAGQIVMQTFPQIGNYGVAGEDVRGKCCVSGYVVREMCDTPSNFRSECTLDEFLKNNGICGICGVDTREITRILRDEGAMNAAICSELPADMAAIKAYSVAAAAAGTRGTEMMHFSAQQKTGHDVALVDMGAAGMLTDELSSRGCDVTVYPADVKAEVILKGEHDGVVISDGPGNPADEVDAVNEIAALAGKIPMLAIGLGHQLTALAMGGKTFRLKHGHHGAAQPVKHLVSGRTYICEENSMYAVDAGSMTAGAAYVNLNDGICEGVNYGDARLISVQFRPATAVGPNSTGYVYDEFIEMMGGGEDAQR